METNKFQWSRLTFSHISIPKINVCTRSGIRFSSESFNLYEIGVFSLWVSLVLALTSVTAWKVSVFGVYSVSLRIQSECGKIRTKKLRIWTLFTQCLNQQNSLKTFKGNSFALDIWYLDLRPATLSKKRLWRRCFPVNFAKFLRTPFLTEHLRWLLLLFW